MVKRIILAVFLGLVASIANLQHDPYVKAVVGNGFRQALETALDCHMECSIESINFFWPSICLTDIKVTPCDGSNQWYWQAKKYTTSFSWAHLLQKGMVDLRVHMQDLVAWSDYSNGNLAMLPHLKKMAIGDPSMPIILQAIDLEHIALTITNDRKQQTAHLEWSSKTVCKNHALDSTIAIQRSGFTQGTKRILHDLGGDITCSIGLDGAFVVATALTGIIDDVGKKLIACTLAGNGDNAGGLWNIKTDQPDLAVNHLKVFFRDTVLTTSIEGKFPLATAIDIANDFGIPIPIIDGKGEFNAEAALPADGPHITGSVALGQIDLPLIPESCKLVLSFSADKDNWQGTLDAGYGLACSLEGQWAFDAQKKKA